MYVTQGNGLLHFQNHIVAVFAGVASWPVLATAIMTVPGGGMRFDAVDGMGIANGLAWLQLHYL